MNTTRMIQSLALDRTAQTLLIAVAILACVRAPWPSTLHEDRYYYYEKLTWKANADVVILGDSRALVALAPKTMAADLTNLRVRNFSFAGVGYSSDYLTAAEKVWDDQGPAKIALLGITARSLRGVSQKDNQFINSSKTLSLSTYWKARCLGWVPQVWRPLDRPFLEQLVRGQPQQRSAARRDADGWFEPRADNGGNAESLHYYREIRHDPIRSDCIDLLLAKVREWTEQGIHVYGFRPPTCQEMEALEDDFAEASFAQAFEDAGGRWLAPSPAGLTTCDASHLDRRSVTVFSERVAKAVSLTEKPLAVRAVGNTH